MPTGYTAAIIRDDIDFKTFATNCMRASGALVNMRDDPFDAPIPDEILPYPHHKDELEKAKRDLGWFISLTQSQLRHEYGSDMSEKRQRRADQLDKLNEDNRRLNTMLEKVKAFTPPTTEHTGWKTFMIEQITISIEKPYRHDPEPDFETWVEKKKKDLRWSISYHADEWIKEVELAKNRTSWLQQAKAAIESAE